MLNPPLAGKVLVVVGGTSGMGLSAAKAFAAAGARLAVLGLDQESCQCARQTLGGEMLVHQGNAADSDSADRLISAASDRWGAIGGLFHVAGGSGRRWGDGPLHELTDEGWRGTLELNAASIAWSNRAAIRQFLRQGTGGSILNMASVLASNPSPHYFATHAYAAAKASVIGLSIALASHYAEANIRVNVLAPGLVETPMAQRAAGSPEILKFIRTKQPLDGGRIGQPADIDGAAVFFMSDASRFTTGQVLAVDGGWSLSEGQWATGH